MKENKKKWTIFGILRVTIALTALILLLGGDYFNSLDSRYTSWISVYFRFVIPALAIFDLIRLYRDKK